MAEYTRFTKVSADCFAGCLHGVSLSKAADYSLTDDEKGAYVGITMTAASKVLTLGLKDGDVALIVNEGGTNALTVKNVSGDSGTSLGAGKAMLICASTTANSSKVTILTDGDGT